VINKGARNFFQKEDSDCREDKDFVDWEVAIDTREARGATFGFAVKAPVNELIVSLRGG